MKRLLTALAALTALFTLTACNPPFMIGGGWFEDPGPANPITVDNNIGVDIPGAVARINAAAGLTIMVPVASGGRVAFAQQIPIIDPSGVRHAMWVQVFRNGTAPYVNYCVIHYDPTFFNGSPTYWDKDAFSHELGHCLDYPDVQIGQENGYEGAMAYANWGDPWWRLNKWWQNSPDDRAMLARDGYGP